MLWWTIPLFDIAAMKVIFWPFEAGKVECAGCPRIALPRLLLQWKLKPHSFNLLFPCTFQSFDAARFSGFLDSVRITFCWNAIKLFHVNSIFFSCLWMEDRLSGISTTSVRCFLIWLKVIALFSSTRLYIALIIGFDNFLVMFFVAQLSFLLNWSFGSSL